MELEDLKTAWNSVKPHINPMSGSETDQVLRKRKLDVRRRFILRSVMSMAFAALCLTLVATSRIWAPVKFPVWWLFVFCGSGAVTLILGADIIMKIKRLNLWRDTHSEIMASVVRIKKLYRRTEFGFCIVATLLMMWLSFNPPFVNSWRMLFVWIVTAAGMTLEYLWYRYNSRQLDKLNQ